MLFKYTAWMASFTRIDAVIHHWTHA